jgi:hypothetical protein
MEPRAPISPLRPDLGLHRFLAKQLLQLAYLPLQGRSGQGLALYGAPTGRTGHALTKFLVLINGFEAPPPSLEIEKSIPPRWNAAPSQELLVIRRNHQTGEV